MNAVRGLLDIIARLASEFQPTEMVACWDDDWRPQWRVDLIPTYKAHRVAVAPSADAAAPVEEVPDLVRRFEQRPPRGHAGAALTSCPSIEVKAAGR